jgi:hypothetical protein
MIFGVWLASGISPYPSTCAVPSHKAAGWKSWTPRGPLSAPPILPLAQTLYHEVVHLIEFRVGIPRPEIVPPAANDGRQFRDDLLHILPALSRPSVLAGRAPALTRTGLAPVRTTRLSGRTMAGILAPRSPVFSPTVDCLQSLVVGKTESSSTADNCGSKTG